MKNKNKFENAKRELEEKKIQIDGLIKIKEKSIGTESENIKKLKHFSNNADYVLRLSNDVDPKTLNSLNIDIFSNFINPLITISTTATIIEPNVQIAANYQTQLVNEGKMFDATGSASYVAVSSLDYFASQNPKYFPNYSKIHESVKEDIGIEEKIKFIENELIGINPDVARDFKYFIDKFYASADDTSKYQDLIGARSMLFFKELFQNENISAKKDHRQEIKKYIFGNTSFDPSLDTVIESYIQLYNNLSNQVDQKGNSAKMGNLTEDEIKKYFVYIINTMESILKFRQLYYS